MVQAMPKLATERFSFVKSKLLRTASNSSGLTLAVLTNQAARSLQRRLTLCFAGTRMRLDAMCICLTFQPAVLLETAGSPADGKRHSRKVDGLLVAGRFKSLLLQ